MVKAGCYGNPARLELQWSRRDVMVILQGWNCSGQGGMLWQMKRVGQLHSESSMVGLKLFF